MDLDGYLQLLYSSLPPTDALVTVETLLKIIQNVLDHPAAENYRRLRTANKTFQQRVWRHSAAQELMAAIGWIEVEGDVVLPSDIVPQEAVIALTKLKSLLEEQLKTTSGASSDQTSQHEPTPTTTASTESAISHQERMRKLKETQKRVEEEKRRIAEQIKADRQEASKKESRASHGRQLKFGGKLNRFEDIGVDLNAGG